MASLLRQIVAGPRARHAEAGLDLCYVTDFIIATSGPSQTYPQLAYRNPLDQLVAFLDSKHGDNWAIWEFRAEGTGYPDEAVYGRVRHYPWPDHHPPPFRLVPMIMVSMRNWLHGGDLLDSQQTPGSRPKDETVSPTTADAAVGASPVVTESSTRSINRVVVVHCKAGKGRSGTMATSYLISEEGWTAEDALHRFTTRRMRPKFGAGVSIPSQLRWVSYVDRWTKHGKKYLDRSIEIVEIHVWGLRNGVKVDVGGFVEDGKKIQVLHTFSTKERHVVQDGVPEEAGIRDILCDLAGYSSTGGTGKAPEKAELANASNPGDGKNGEPPSLVGPFTSAPEQQDGRGDAQPSSVEKKRHTLIRKGTGLIQKVSANVGDGLYRAKSKTGKNATTTADTIIQDDQTTAQELKPSEDPEPGGLAVILKPERPIRVPTSDVNIGVERRNNTRKSLGLTMVSAVAHVWFNAFFEGQGPELDGRPCENGIFSIDWEAMDGIKGSSRKGSRALDRMSVVWRAVDNGKGIGEEIVEPAEGEPVPQLAAADWKGVADGERDLGLRPHTEESQDVSRASSLKSEGGAKNGEAVTESGKGDDNDDRKVMESTRSSGPTGEDLVKADKTRA